MCFCRPFPDEERVWYQRPERTSEEDAEVVPFDDFPAETEGEPVPVDWPIPAEAPAEAA